MQWNCASAVSKDSGLLCLYALAQFHQIGLSVEHLKHQYGPDTFSCETILRAAKDLDLRARRVDLTGRSFVDLPMPAIAQRKDGEFVVLVRAFEDKQSVLIQDVGSDSGNPELVSFNCLSESLSTTAILVTKRARLQRVTSKFDISWFVPAILKHKRVLGQVLVASFFIQLFALVTPLFFQVVIDKVLAHQGLSTLDVLCFGLLVISIFDAVLNGLRNYVFSHTTHRVDVTLGARLFRHLMHLPLAYFQTRQVGTTVARVHELNTIREFITSSALTLIIDLGFTVIFFVVMWFYSPTLTWIVLGSLPFYIALSASLTPVLRKRLDEKFQRGAANQAFLVESVSGAETLKSMAVEPQMQKRWEEQLAAYVTAAFKAGNLSNIANQSASFINKIVTVLILWVGAGLVMAGSLSVGQLIAFNMIAGRVSAPILKLVQLWQDFQQAGISVARLGDILNSPAEPALKPGRSTLPAISGEVSFEHVRFRYAPDRPEILHDLSMKVASGEIIGIVGRSGSGKSTLGKMIQRLYVPEAGRVLVDGVDLAQVDTAWLRRQVGVVLQESRMFNRSVRDNIALIDSSIPMQQVIQAAKLAGAHEFILELPEGYDTEVGEQGASLSGGQKQRLALARALVSNPAILILDEATSALDYESERLIQNNMQEICRGRTVFIIAHRLSTVRGADRIIVLDKGRIIEDGNHESLLERDGYYASLHALQNHTSKIRSVGEVSSRSGSSQSTSSRGTSINEAVSSTPETVPGYSVTFGAKEEEAV